MMADKDRPRRRVVVFGGTGWLGRQVCGRFRARGDEVLTVARWPASGPAAHWFRRLDVSAATVTEFAELISEADADIVVNATDGANARDGWEHTEASLRSANVEGVERLLAALSTLRSVPRLVHIGTIHEYGPPLAGLRVTEDTEPRPASAYARTKLAGSEAVLAAAQSGSVDAMVLRLTNLCGPGPSPASFPGKLLRRFHEAAAAERPGQVIVQVVPARRDFLDVRDAARAVVAAADSAVTGTVCNLGSGRAVPVSELVSALRLASGLPPEAIRAEQVPGSAEWLEVETRRANRLLGWTPSITLAESMAAMWAAA